MARRRWNGKRATFYSRVSEADADDQADTWLQAQEQAAKPPTPILYDPETVAGFVASAFNGDRSEIRPTTRRTYNSMLRQHILPALGHLRLDAVTAGTITEMAAGLKRKDKRPGPLSPKKKREIILLAREVFELAVRQEKIPADPTAGVKLPKVKKKTIRHEPEEDFTARLLAHVKGTYLEGPIICALFLGFRRGEICGLMWKHLDRKNNTILVNEQRQPEYVGQGPTKGDDRLVPIPPRLMRMIEARGDRGNIYVFTDDKKRPLLSNELSKNVPKAIIAAGLGRRKLHDLRSFAASNLVELGADLPMVMEILGHTKLDTTWLYLFSKSKAKREALNAVLDSAFGREADTGT